MFFTSPLAQASSNSDFEMSPLPSLSTCAKLTINGAAADFASRLPDGTALFQIAGHCSGFRAAEGRPDVMVFVFASAQVSVNGSTTREIMDALNICLLLVLAKFTLPPTRGHFSASKLLRASSKCPLWVISGHW